MIPTFEGKKFGQLSLNGLKKNNEFPTEDEVFPARAQSAI
jgi:hypothetical protein